MADAEQQHQSVALVAPCERRVLAEAPIEAVVGDDRAGERAERNEGMAWVRTPDDAGDVTEALDDGAHLPRRRDLRVERRGLRTNHRPPRLRHRRVLPEARVR